MPFVIVAVRITVASPSPKAGRVTVPFVLITAGLLLTQLIVDPLVPLVGNVRLPVTSDVVSPSAKVISSAVLSAITESSSVIF